MLVGAPDHAQLLRVPEAPAAAPDSCSTWDERLSARSSSAWSFSRVNGGATWRCSQLPHVRGGHGRQSRLLPGQHAHRRRGDRAFDRPRACRASGPRRFCGPPPATSPARSPGCLRSSSSARTSAFVILCVTPVALSDLLLPTRCPAAKPRRNTGTSSNCRSIKPSSPTALEREHLIAETLAALPAVRPAPPMPCPACRSPPSTSRPGTRR